MFIIVYLTNLIPNINELRSMNIKSFRFDFIDESYDETKRFYKHLKMKSGKMTLVNLLEGIIKEG